MMNHNILYNIINEEINNYLIDETYKSINEIKKLAVDVIKSIAENNIKQIKERGQIDYLFGTYLNAIDANKYDELKNFIDETNIAILIDQQKPDSSVKGAYTTSINIPYNPRHERDIELYVDDMPQLFNEINQSIKEIGQEKYNKNDLYFKLFYELYDPLIHELQHAYDDFRSRGKIYKTKEYAKYREKYQDTIETNINNDVKRAQKYLNLPHEIWARFTQAMYKVRFTDLHIENGKCNLTMKPIKKVVKDFRLFFPHYYNLSDKMKRKLINKVVQFWHYEQNNLDEKIKELNK